MTTLRVPRRVLATYDVGDIITHTSHPSRIVEIDLDAGTATLEPLGWVARLWLRMVGR